MKRSFAAVVAALLLAAGTADAHRLDEYLQATMISVGRDRVQLQLRLTPGVAVFTRVVGGIDANSDGILSDAEQRAYAERVVRDLSLAVDGTPLPLRLTAWKFGSVADMREGLGEIRIDLDAPVPAGGEARRLTFENRHERTIAVYLVNALIPGDSAIRITGQLRSVEQSSYRLDFSQSGALADSGAAWWTRSRAWLLVIAAAGLAQLALLSRRRPAVEATGRGRAV